MRYLAFDVGIKNFSYCMVSFNENGQHIIEKWDCISLIGDNEKCKSKSLDQLTELMLIKLGELFDNTIEIDIVLIENQPNTLNPLMKTLSVVIYTFFNLLRIQIGSVQRVKFISSTKKLSCQLVTQKAKSYNDRKKISIETTCKYLDNIDINKKIWFLKQKKKDDLSDAFLYTIYFYEANSNKAQ